MKFFEVVMLNLIILKYLGLTEMSWFMVLVPCTVLHMIAHFTEGKAKVYFKNHRGVKECQIK